MLASRRVKTAFAVAALATVVTASAAATAPAASAAKGVSHSLRHLQRLPEPQRRGPAGRRPVHTRKRAGPDRRRDHPARPPRCGADQRVRLRRRRPLGALPAELPRHPAEWRRPVDYPYLFLARSNTGVPSGLDLDNNGSVGVPNDAFGFGFFPGQFGMAVLSSFPIEHDRLAPSSTSSGPTCPVPSCRTTLRRRAGGLVFACRARVFRLSSKSHWDVPLASAAAVHVLASHPTPLVFDGPGGPKRPAQPRRDPLLGRLHHPRRGRLPPR